MICFQQYIVSWELVTILPHLPPGYDSSLIWFGLTRYRSVSECDHVCRMHSSWLCVRSAVWNNSLFGAIVWILIKSAKVFHTAIADAGLACQLKQLWGRLHLNDLTSFRSHCLVQIPFRESLWLIPGFILSMKCLFFFLFFLFCLFCFYSKNEHDSFAPKISDSKSSMRQTAISFEHIICWQNVYRPDITILADWM